MCMMDQQDCGAPEQLLAPAGQPAHLIDRGTHRLGEAMVVERAGIGARSYGCIMHLHAQCSLNDLATSAAWQHQR